MRFRILLIPLAWLLGCPSGAVAPGTDAKILDYLEQAMWSPSQGGRTVCAYEQLGIDERSQEAYVWAVCEEHLGSGRSFGGRSGPIVLLKASDGTVIDHREPRDGSAYSADVRRLFPAYVRAEFEDQNARTQQDRVERLLNAVRSRAESTVARRPATSG